MQVGSQQTQLWKNKFCTNKLQELATRQLYASAFTLYNRGLDT